MLNKFSENIVAIRGLNLSVKHWHINSAKKIIALHGWLDNAASFDRLAPLLPEYSIAAIDLAGQGYSEHRPASSTYHLWDDLLDILALADQFGWTTFSLIGHSRGAMLATMLAASCPERIEQIILLDGLLPLPVASDNAPQQLRQFLLDNGKTRFNRIFESREQAIAVRARVGTIPESVVEILAQRQLLSNEEGWYWHVDERLKIASAFKLTAEHNQAFLQAINCKVTIILASKGWGGSLLIKQVQEQYTQFLWHIVDGHHHLHLDQQATEVARLCLNSLNNI